jgi:type I restriction enzyme S subunit
MLLKDLLLETKDGDWGQGDPADSLLPYHVIRATDFAATSLGNNQTVPLRYLPKHTVDRRTLQLHDVLIETAGGSPGRPTGRTMLVTQRVIDSFEGPITCASFARFLRADPDRIDPRYLYWFLQALYQSGEIEQYQVQHTGVARFQYTQFAATQRVPMPKASAQRAVADVLGALDDKIAANTKLIALLDAHMALEYTAAVANGIRESPLAAVAEFHNRRRVPLSAREREQKPGDVPYYGASGVFGTVDEAIFDEPLVLVGEDGSVINADGTPVVQYIWGPAWVNNHAHVLTGTGLSTELLYIAISRAQVATLVTGAVQPKINMGNLKQLMLELPAEVNMSRLESIVGTETATKRATTEQNRTLSATRDALLPQLMSGNLRVREAEKVLENAGV